MKRRRSRFFVVFIRYCEYFQEFRVRKYLIPPSKVFERWVTRSRTPGDGLSVCRADFVLAESRFGSREPKKEAMKDIPTDQSDSVKNYFNYEYVKGSELSC